MLEGEVYGREKPVAADREVVLGDLQLTCSGPVTPIG
jgi:hypothetical protein